MIHSVGVGSVYFTAIIANVKNDLILGFKTESSVIHIITFEHPTSMMQDLYTASTYILQKKEEDNNVYPVIDDLITGNILQNQVEGFTTPLLTFYTTKNILYKIIGESFASLSIPESFRINVKIIGNTQTFNLVQNFYRANIVPNNFMSHRWDERYSNKLEKSFYNIGNVSPDSVKIENNNYFGKSVGGIAYTHAVMHGMKMNNIGNITNIQTEVFPKKVSREFSTYNNGASFYSEITSISERFIVAEPFDVIHEYFDDFIVAHEYTGIDPVYMKIGEVDLLGEVSNSFINLGDAKKLEYFSLNSDDNSVKSIFLNLFTYSKYKSGINSIMSPIIGYSDDMILGNVPKNIEYYKEEILIGYPSTVIEDIEIDSTEYNVFANGSIVLSQSIFGVEGVSEYIGIYRIGSFQNTYAVGLNREVFIDKIDMFETKYSPRITESSKSGVFERNIYNSILNFNRTNTDSFLIGDTYTNHLVSEGRDDMGIDMRAETSFNFKNDVRYEYYQYESGTIIFDFRTKTNPILHFTSGPEVIQAIENYHSGYDITLQEMLDVFKNGQVDKDYLFECLILINTYAYKKWSSMLKDLAGGQTYSQESIFEMTEYLSRKNILDMHTFISSLQVNAPILIDILIGISKKVSSDLFNETTFVEYSGIKSIDIYAPVSTGLIYRKSVKTIKKSRFIKSNFFGVATLSTGMFRQNLYPNMLSEPTEQRNSGVSFPLSIFPKNIISFKRVIYKSGIYDDFEVSGRVFPKAPYVSEVSSVFYMYTTGSVMLVGDLYERFAILSTPDAKIEDVVCDLATFNTEKEIFPYYAKILDTLGNNLEVGVGGSICDMVTVEVIGTYTIFNTHEKMIKVNIALLDKRIFYTSDKIVFAKLLLYKEAFKIDEYSKFMKFDTTEFGFYQPMSLSHRYVDIFKADSIQGIGKGGDSDISEMFSKEDNKSDPEIEETVGSWTVCQDDSSSYMDSVGFDHVVTSENGVHVGNFSYSEREVLNSSVISQGRKETLGKGREISKISGIQKTIEQKTISSYMVVDKYPDWDPTKFALTDTDFTDAGLTEREKDKAVRDFGEGMADFLEDIAKDPGALGLGDKTTGSNKPFPGFDNFPVDDGVLSKEHKVQQYQEITVDED